MKPSTIHLTEVGRSWGPRVALANVDLHIEPGERVALIGPSGSGKTTLLRLIMASLKSSEGEVRIGDTAIADMTPKQIRAHRRRCGLVDQSLQVLPGLSVHDNVIAGRVASWPWWKTLAGTLLTFDKDDVEQLLADVGLGERQWDKADTLSGGQRQRVAIARALAGCPTLLLADEPTAALDPTTAAEGIELLVRESRKRGATLIISTHQANLVLPHIDRVIGLRESRLVLDTVPDKIEASDLDALYEGSGEQQ